MTSDVLTIEGYLAALAERLPGPRRARAAVLDELRDGLIEATARHTRSGRSPRAAAPSRGEAFAADPTDRRAGARARVCAPARAPWLTKVRASSIGLAEVSVTSSVSWSVAVPGAPTVPPSGCCRMSVANSVPSA